MNGGLPELDRLDVGANTCPRGFFNDSWFFVGCSAPYHLAHVVEPTQVRDPQTVTIFDGVGNASWTSPPNGVIGESEVWIGSAEGMNRFSLPYKTLTGPTIDASSMATSSTFGSIVAWAVRPTPSSSWEGATVRGPISAPQGFDAAFVNGGNTEVLIGKPGTHDALQIQTATGAVLKTLAPPTGSGASSRERCPSTPLPWRLDHRRRDRLHVCLARRSSEQRDRYGGRPRDPRQLPAGASPRPHHQRGRQARPGIHQHDPHRPRR